MERNYSTSYRKDPREYSGTLELYDFEGHYTMASMARKIAREEAFIRMCKNNTLNVERSIQKKKLKEQEELQSE